MAEIDSNYRFLKIKEMSKEVAEKALDEILYQGKSIREWMQIIASEDAISRQAVIDAIDKWVKNMGVLIALPANEVTPLFNSIHALPPVTPQPKIGRWIDDKCSICGKGIENLIDSREWYKNEIPNYCPFCGARVIESE